MITNHRGTEVLGIQFRKRASRGLGASVVCVLVATAAAQQLIDRVVARVDGYALTLSDLRMAAALGIVRLPPGGDDLAGTGQLVDRQLVLGEVARFAPPEPSAAAVDREVAVLTEGAGGRLAAIMASTGLTEARLREIARDNLRIEAYINQRFGTSAQLTEEEVLEYYRIHPDEFTRDGRLAPFGEAEPEARQRAAAQRRAATLAQWQRDLRVRSEVVIVGSRQ